MLTRYAVVAGAMALWSLLAVPAWYRDPIAAGALFGSPALGHLLLFGVVGFVVIGTLYHVVPFIVWVHRYSDALGLGDVPMVDDLYNDRLAAVDFWFVLAGSGALVLSEWVPLTRLVTITGGVLAVCGFLVFAANVLLVVREHSPHSLPAIVPPWIAEASSAGSVDGHREPHE